MRHPLLLLPLVSGCWLEEVTGEPVPLDPRFYAAVEQTQGMPGVGGGDAIPFGSDAREKLTVSGEVTSPAAGPVDIDVRTPDPAAPGGRRGHGKILLDAPGPFELQVPVSLGTLELQAFQDTEGDGPTGDDPFAQVHVVVGSEPVTGVALDLVPGARSGVGPEHHEAPPGAPGGAGSGLPGSEPDPFVATDGPRVTVRGTLQWEGEGVIALDLFRPDVTAPGGQAQLGKLLRAPGPFELRVPRDFGPLVLEAFVDADANGPGPGDPMGRYAENPLVVGSTDIDGVDITLSIPEDGMMPQGGPAPPPPPGMQ